MKANNIRLLLQLLLIALLAILPFLPLSQGVHYGLTALCALLLIAATVEGWRKFRIALEDLKQNLTDIELLPEEVQSSESGETAYGVDDTQIQVSRIGDDENRKIQEALTTIAKILPLLNAQLKGVIEYTDEAAMGLSESFFGINKKAKGQVQSLKDIFGSLGNDTGESTSENDLGTGLLNIRKDLSAVFEGLNTLSEQIHTNANSIRQVIAKTSEISALIENTNRIADDSRVLSINASVEAARAGELGKGFAVVASEFKKLTERSDEYSTQIGETVTQVIEAIKKAELDLENSEKISRQLDETTRQSSEVSLQRIDDMIAHLSSGLLSVSATAEEFAAEISKIIYSIQFQDITRQRIEHVIEPLEQFSKDIHSISGAMNNPSEDGVLEELAEYDGILDELKKKYTMESERKLLDEQADKE